MTDENRRPLKVFLCHASGDKPVVRELYKRLIAEGVDAWLDQEKLLPGQDWRVEIPRAVREADVVVVCLSNKSITKEGYVQREIRFALDSAAEKPEGTIFLIPARLEDCIVPEGLDRWQWVDLFDENGFMRLLRSLKLRADRVGATIEPLGYESEDQEIERRLDQLYTEGLAAFWVEDWDRACQRFQAILRERPNHKNAVEKLAQAERQRNLANLYAQATEAYQSENWPDAVNALEELLGKSSDYKDALRLLKDAKKQSQLREFYAEAKRLHSAQKWQAVTRVFEQIAAIDSQYPDPESLLSTAQREVAELKRLTEMNDLYRQGVHQMDANQWYEARKLLEQVHKAQTGFLDTERLLRKVEDEIIRIEELNNRNIQVNTLYEQAHGLIRSKNWRMVLEKMQEIRKLDDQFVDKDGIFEKAKAELEREEQEARRQRELDTLYAEAVSLLQAKKYQEALEKWNAIQAIEPKYKDTSRVKIIAKRKLDELSSTETAGRLWPKRITDWIRVEAHIPVDREILTEKLLLLSFASILFITMLDAVLLDLLQIGKSGVAIRLLRYSILGGLYGTVLAFVFNKAVSNWHRKQSVAVIVGWVISYAVTWILWEYYFDRGSTSTVTLINSLTAAAVTIVAIKWARPTASPIGSLVILAIWALIWEAGNILAENLVVFGTDYTWPIVDALAILLSLLFVFGMEVERSREVLITATFGALGFAVGNYIVDNIAILKVSLPEEIATPIALGLWGLIGGSILEAPSRNARRIRLSAGICAIGLLVGYLIGSILVPAVIGPFLTSVSPIVQEQTAILRNISWGIGLGIALGLMTRRGPAITVLAIVGAGIYTMTRALNVDAFDISPFWENIVRGALIGLVLGYGYGYMRKTN